ncbi:MAG TPA: CHAD domain-containing protein [Bacteroidota bacterium]|nr:CHAD domain-containing protein [Bacteroidota bacterium]
MGKPWPVLGFEPDMPVQQSLEQIIRARLQEFFSQYDAAMRTGDPEAVHQARVSIRRIQTVGKVFPAHFHAKRLTKILDHLRAFHRALGTVRASDVAVERLEMRIEGITAPDPRGALLLAGQMHVRRQESFKNMKREWKGLSRQVIEEKILASVRSPKRKKEKPHLLLPFRDAAAGVYPDLFSSFLESYAPVLDHPNATKQFHAARLKGKRLRYLMEVCVSFTPKEFGVLLEELKEVLRSFGEVNDIDLQLELYRSSRRQIARYNRSVAAGQKLPVDIFTTLTALEREERTRTFEKLRTGYARLRERQKPGRAMFGERRTEG